jgi:hypothetical protein
MTKEYQYKKQGNGSDSWTVTEKDDDGNVTDKYMVYERPEGHADTLEQAKEIKLNQIDAKTQELIFLGFAFAGLQWSLSLTAQINWSNLSSIPEQFFPLPLQDMNEQSYSLAYANRMNFYLTAVGTKNSRLQSGSVLKQQVSLLATIEDALNFVDPR